MGCICSKYSSNKDKVEEYGKESEWNKSSVQLVAPTQLNGVGVGLDGSKSVPRLAKTSSQVTRVEEEKSSHFDVAIKSQHHRCMTVSSGIGEKKPLMSRILSVQNFSGEQYVDSGWPLWLSSVAKEAIKGWVPRRADSFEKLDQIGQGAYSSVHKALDLETGKYVALKKVRFSSGDVESVRFMAREIYILRQLDHPNILKLEGLVTSRTSTSLYLVFEYMEHDLAGLAARPGVKFTEPQIKCFMKQLLSGLEHCHSRGVLHRDIKGSNLLVDNNGNLKIGDFGLATVHEPNSKVPLTSRVVTLWYRAPELLLGATDYGATIDLWSAGCILAELLVGKPIMPGRTEVEQMHKIFKLCGSPSEEYWQRKKLPYATSFKPQNAYKRQLADTFKDFPSTALALVDKLLAMEPEQRGSATSALHSEFFTTEPLPCDPSRLPKFPPSKEFDLKRQNKEAARKNTEAVKGRGPGTVLRGAGNTKALEAPEYNPRGDLSLRGKPNTKMSRLRYESQEDDESNLKCETSRISMHNGYTNSTALMHNNTTKRPESSMQKNIPELRTQRSDLNKATIDFSTKKEQDVPGQESGTGYVPKKNRIHCSGPLMMSSGGNIDDMLREHERLMQDVFRSVKKGNS
ncbi:putative serine/threonine-protein kinase [Trifolium repens]|nr:putative serine/threonine-protein kinase [Trifolium repens]